MTSIVQRLAERKLITPPPFVGGSVQFEALMGREFSGPRGLRMYRSRRDE